MSDTHDRRRALAAQAQPPASEPTLEQVIAAQILCFELRTVTEPGTVGTLRKRRAWLIAKVCATLMRDRYHYVDDIDAGELVINWNRAGIVKVWPRDNADTGSHSSGKDVA